MEKQLIIPEGTDVDGIVIAPGVRVGGFLYLSGTAGYSREKGGLVGDDIEPRARQAMENLGKVLEAAGSCLKHVVKTTVFLADIGEFGRMNAVYAEFFPEKPPSRSAVQAAALPLGGRVEIEAVAMACNCEGGEGDCECDSA